MSDIDLIIYWVDGNDPEWQKKKASYTPGATCDAASNRYRDMGTLKYFFRGVEKFAPWARKVFFVTDGQIPEWMDTGNPRLTIVDHKDYIPEKYLPVFSSHPIELNFHRIEGLSEHFVVINDDFFFTAPSAPEDFFQNGLPVDIMTEMPLQYKTNHVYNRILFNNYDTIGKYFPDRKEYKKRLKNKMLSPKYGAYFFYNLITYMLPYSGFWGVHTPHFMRPYRKTDFIKMWEMEGELLDRTCSSRFRSENDVSIYLIRLWNIMNGDFVPGNIFKMGHAIVLKKDDPGIYSEIRSGKHKMLCLNDELSDSDFDAVSAKICSAFEDLLPEKSGFEK
ncbi:MAG: stealth family protein [Clostridiales bacterium]|nr:stealth family protein [Clostridiales bacterium]